MSAPTADRAAAEMELVAAQAEIERLQRQVADLEDALKGARQSVTEQQQAERAHALACPLAKRPATKPAACAACAACGEERPIKSRGWCSACYSRWLDHGKPESGPPPRREPPKCGTRQGWDRHMYRGEKACGPCRKAHADDVREWSHTSPRLRSRSEPCAEWDAKQAAAARKVAEVADDADDCRDLLVALGLLPELNEAVTT